MAFKTMTRGYSDEGDKILNYLVTSVRFASSTLALTIFYQENGIFDALQKEYLKSFIFAIYLYHVSPESGVTIPIMTLGDDLRQMSLNNARDNPVTEAAKKGKAPTLLDVKKSVKAGDEEKDKWYFMTHDLDEVPDKWSIGKNNAAFGETMLRQPVAPNLTPAQEASLRAAQAEQQLMDAQVRAVAWSGDEAVELSDADGEGEDDPDYMRLPDGTYKRIATGTPGALIPSGIRNNKTGDIEPLCGPMDAQEAHFAGVSEKLHTKLNDLNREKPNEKSNLEQTQVVEDLFTQDVPMASPSPENQTSMSSMTTDSIFHSSRRQSSWTPPPLSPVTSIISRQGSDPDIDMLKEMHAQPSINETIQLDMETQIESIESFGPGPGEGTADEVNARRTRSSSKKSVPDNGLECECGVVIHVASVKADAAGGSMFGTTRDVSRRLLGRLEREGFMTQQTVTLDDLGFPLIADANSKSKTKATKQPKSRKNVQPKVYIFNREALHGAKYADYFNPDPTVEGRLLKITEMTSRLKTLQNPDTDPSNASALHLAQIFLKEPRIETQTQAETQLLPHDAGLKRNKPADDRDETPKAKKKIKISVTHGLDLAE
ncbi:hypothetical protein DXG01_016421 [Tephrocybe rancida]|nr:hypothetical protein DXG01_016421 [Tephrocybe rancida]